MHDDELWSAVELVRQAARHGTVADLRRLPAPQQIVPAALLVALLLTEGRDGGQPMVHPRGVNVMGALITGKVDLEHAQAHVPLVLTGCTLTASPLLECAVLPALVLENCQLPGIEADGIRIEHDFRVSSSRISNEVKLRDARIGGQLDCVGATLHNLFGVAISADRAEIAGGMFLRPLVRKDGQDPLPCQVKGEVRLRGARIGGQLSCVGATLYNPGGNALSAKDAEIAGGVVLDSVVAKGSQALLGCEASGEVELLDARIGGLYCTGATLNNLGGNALHANDAEIAGGVFLRPLVPRDGQDPLPCRVTVRCDCLARTSAQGSTAPAPS